MTQNATQAKKSRSFTVGVSFRLSSYYSLPRRSDEANIQNIKEGKISSSVHLLIVTDNKYTIVSSLAVLSALTLFSETMNVFVPNFLQLMGT